MILIKKGYREYQDKTERFTLEIHTFVDESTIVKLFNRDEEEFRMEYKTESPVVLGAINSLIQMMNNELYQHN
jgi:hypothetical protein